MTTKLIHLDCPEYQLDNLDVSQVGDCIDDILVDNLSGQKIILRAVQSEKHDLPKDELVKRILKFGTDRFDTASKHAIQVSDTPIDLFGYECDVKKPMAARILNGFHTWKPMSLERPQRKADIWLVYSPTQLENVEYHHTHYNVIAHDGYRFKRPNQAADALLALLVID
jgi:hypothetical protein